MLIKLGNFDDKITALLKEFDNVFPDPGKEKTVTSGSGKSLKTLHYNERAYKARKSLRNRIVKLQTNAADLRHEIKVS